jgi:hypothetical protein
VKEHLVKVGNVAEDRLVSVGKGETTPIGDNKTAEGRELNRRVEFHIIKEAAPEVPAPEAPAAAPEAPAAAPEAPVAAPEAPAAE